jgi:hypothetical protein
MEPEGSLHCLQEPLTGLYQCLLNPLNALTLYSFFIRTILASNYVL